MKYMRKPGSHHWPSWPTCAGVPPNTASDIRNTADMVSWIRLGLYNAPFFFINTLGCYNKLKELYDQMVEDEFLDASELEFMHFVTDVDEMERIIE